MARVSRKELLVRVALVLGSVVLGLVALEVGYRIKLVSSPYRPLTAGPERFTASPIVFGEYDAVAGVHYAPGSSQTIVTITVDGKVTWAPDEPIAACNRDGYSGKTLRDEYARSDLKVVTFGDSFTNWRQDGDTWPDLFQQILSAKLGGKSVGVLNAARGGTGVLQMFDLAAHILPDLKPDLAVFAFISDDLSRSRWWTRAVQWNGFTRPLQSPSPEVFDLQIAIDEYIVNPSITPEWAKSTFADPGKGGPLLAELVHQYELVRGDFHRARDLKPIERSPWSLGEVYLWNRIRTGQPVQDHVASIPRMNITDYARDPQLMSALEKVRSLRIPILLLHIPNFVELEHGGPGYTSNALFGYARRDRKLAESLERVTGQEMVLLERELEGTTVPAKIDLLPYNGHPNHAGLQLYAELAAKVVAREMEKR